MSVNTIVWEQRQTGAATNGAGFDATVTSPGTDYSKQDSPQYALTGVTSSGANSNVLLTASASADMNGNVGYLASGTNATVGWFLITSVSVGVSLTVVSVNAIGNATGAGGAMAAGAFNIGGAIARLDTILGTTQVVQPGNVVFCLKGASPNLSSTTNTLGADGSGANGLIYIIGYSSTRTLFHDEVESGMPIFTSSTNNISIFSLNAASYLYFANIKVTSTGTPTRGNGFVGLTAASTNITFINCVADGCGTGFLSGASASTQFQNSSFIGCTARNCTLTGFACLSSSNINLFNCHSYANVNGFSFSLTGTTVCGLFGCIAEGNSGAGILFTNSTVAYNMLTFDSCVIANNGTYGMSWTAMSATSECALIKNCIFSNNTTGDMSFSNSGIAELHLRINNWFYTVGTRYTNIGVGINDISLSVDPFVNSSGHDFDLNNKAGGGAVIRGAKYPSYIGINGSLTRDFSSGGAAQLRAGNYSSALLGGFDA